MWSFSYCLNLSILITPTFLLKKIHCDPWFALCVPFKFAPLFNFPVFFLYFALNLPFLPFFLENPHSESKF